MRITRWFGSVVCLLLACRAVGPVVALGDETERKLTAAERQEVELGLRGLTARLETLRAGKRGEPARSVDFIADAEVFAKGVAWALRFDTAFAPADVALVKTAMNRCRDRVVAIEANKVTWADKRGRVCRGFVSAVDSSVQPYAVVLPASYDRARPMRLDVVLHGSSQPVGASELRFLSRFDDGDVTTKNIPKRDYIELHPLGRVENGYRWAGETDVFEAIEAACRNYAVDRDRIVLRGMSMGASGTWHLGLKHPDRFVALGPYCGYVDTREFSRTPLPTFVKVGPLPPHQEKTLHMLDSVDYAANAGMVPAIACMGEKDVFFQAHVLMSRAMAQEGLAMVNLIAPGTGHVQDPATHREQMRRIGEIVAQGINRSPKHIRFVTWTLKYSRCAWLQILGLEEHYVRAELEASIEADGTVDVREPENISRFAILSPALKTAAPRLRVSGSLIPVPARVGTTAREGIVLGRREGRWIFQGDLDGMKLDGKRPGLQGPIDDAFTAPFLCVRGTGKAWHPAVHAWSEASLKRFADEWSRYFRGELPVKDDTAVTDDDARRFHLILFGDPGSNMWIGRVLPKLPISWTRHECTIGATRVLSADHAPVLIQPNPLATGRYVALNSGHTFHESELSTLNYLLFPRLGDWSLVKVSGKDLDDQSGPAQEDVVRAGFFDEQWRVSGEFR